MKRIKTLDHAKVSGYSFGSWPFGEPSLFVYVWYIDGLLIDTGHRHMRKEIIDTIQKWSVEQLYVTHHHEDHSANISAITEHFSCPVKTSSKCAALMAAPPPMSPAQHLSWGKYEPYHDFIIENIIIETNQYSFEILQIPGHAADMVCLYEKNQGWLFSADLYLNHYIKYFMKAESMKQQIESLAKIRELEFDAMFCAHNPQFDNPKALLAKKQQFLEDFYGNVERRHKQGMTEKEIFISMQLKEMPRIKLMSLGALSTMNMVRSVIRDVEYSS